MPWSREAWKRITKTSAISDAQILRSLPGIWSGPVVLEGLMPWRILRTSPFETMILWSAGCLYYRKELGVWIVGRGSKILYKIVRWKDLLSSLGQWPKCRYQKYLLFLYRNITNITDSQILQHDLDTLQSWESRNKMEFHPGKCTVLRFSLKQKPTLFTYKIHGINLQTQNSAKYLGVTLDSKLDWN